MAAPRFFLALWVFVWSLSPSCLFGASVDFKKNNPDIGKYEFARSAISALKYINDIHVRWKKSPDKAHPGSDLTMIRSHVAYLIKDNADLRIAKSYFAPYLQSKNTLIRKVADTYITACITLIAVNESEKAVWDQWAMIKQSGIGTRGNETAFLNKQVELSNKRKTGYEMMIQGSLLLTKAILSSQNKDEHGKILALTYKQRKNLNKLLDEWGKEYLGWGLAKGQSYMEACAAVIREVLEDTIYTTIDEQLL